MKRFRRILKLAALALLALVSVGLIWLAVVNARANARLAAKVQELREQQLPTSLADLKRAPAPPADKNAVTYLQRAESAVIAISRGVDAVCEATGEQEYDALWAGRLSPVIEKAIRDLLAMHAQAVPLLMQASECPQYDWQYDYDAGTQSGGGARSFLEQAIDLVGYKREVFRVLYYQALLMAKEGKADDALQVCAAMLRLAKLYGQDPLLMNYLVANAVYSGVTCNAINQVLRSGPLPPKAHESLERALAADDLAAQFRRAMMTERAYSIQCFQEMGWNIRLGFTWFPSFKDDNLAIIDTFNRFAHSSERPYDSKLRAQLKSLEQPQAVFTNLLIPAVESSRMALARGQAAQRCTRVLNQLVLQDPQGTQGLTIDRLGLPAAATTDPFDGEPLRIKHTDRGWLIYSVGSNLKDDGGKLDDDRTDIGLGPIPN